MMVSSESATASIRKLRAVFAISSKVSRNLFDRVFRAHRLVMPQDRLHRDEVNDAGKLSLQRQSVC